MTAITAEWIDEQIAQYTHRREAMVAEAHQRIGELSGRIAELERLRAMVEQPANGKVEESEAT